MKKISPLLIILAGSLWGSMGIFVRNLSTYGLTSLQISAVRCVVTLAFMLLAGLVFDRKMFRIHLRDIWCFLGTGLCSIVFFNYCYFRAIESTSLSVAAILLYTAPSMVVMMSAFIFKERFTVRKIFALVLAFVGCVFVSGIIGSSAGRPGAATVLVGLGAGFGYALYSIFGRFAINRGYSPLTILFYTFLFASVGALCMGNPAGIFRVVSSDGRAALWGLGMGVIVTVMPYTLYTVGLKYTESGKASIMASVEPIVATCIGIIVFDELPTWQTAAGIASVLVSILILNVAPRKKVKFGG